MTMKQKMSVNKFLTITVAASLLLLASCGGRPDIGEPRDNIEAAEEVYSIGVNAYLWRATLDTLSFMPLSAADHESGTVISDWKVNPANANERSKVDVIIAGKELRADALRVSVHRETLQDGNWVSIEPRPEAATQIVTAIIIQARLLRRDNAPL